MRRLAFALSLVLLAAPALAHDYVVGGVKIGHPWSRPAAKGGTGAGFMTLTNTGRDAVTLVAVKSAGAASASVHQTVERNGVFSMRATPILAIAPGQSITFAPGGYHIMFTGLRAPLAPGGKLSATLTFKRGPATIPADVTFNIDPLPQEEHRH